MIKANLSYDENDVSSYVEMVQKLFPEDEVDIFNANDLYKCYTDRKNCMNCKGLKYCKNENKGFIYKKENNNFYYEACKYEKAFLKSNTNLISTLFLPEKILNAKIEDFDMNSESRKKIFLQLNNFLNAYKNKEHSKGLYLYGDFSVGKTYALAVIASELAKNDISSLLIYFPDLVIELKNSIGTNRFQDLINMLKSVDVLMLDDLGSENMTPWIRDEILGPVINYRVLEGKPIFISSNITPKELKKHLAITNLKEDELKAERIISRLTAMVNSLDMSDSSKYERN